MAGLQFVGVVEEKGDRKAATTTLGRAETKKTELEDLRKKAKGEPNDPDLLEQMHTHDFLDVSSIPGRIIGEKKTRTSRFARLGRPCSMRLNTPSTSTTRPLI